MDAFSLGIEDLEPFYGDPYDPFLSSAQPIVRALRQQAEQERERERSSWMVESPLRVTVSLPGGGSGKGKRLKEMIAHSIGEFARRYGLSPMKVPIVLQVIFKPPPGERAGERKDLDNLVSWPLSEVSRQLRPPVLATAPPSMRGAVCYLDAFRLPRAAADTSPGFLVVALAPARFAQNDLWSQADSRVSTWEHSLDWRDLHLQPRRVPGTRRRDGLFLAWTSRFVPTLVSLGGDSRRNWSVVRGESATNAFEDSKSCLPDKPRR